jgi:hypothetical protein
MVRSDFELLPLIIPAFVACSCQDGYYTVITTEIIHLPLCMSVELEALVSYEPNDTHLSGASILKPRQ